MGCRINAGCGCSYPQACLSRTGSALNELNSISSLILGKMADGRKEITNKSLCCPDFGLHGGPRCPWRSGFSRMEGHRKPGPANKLGRGSRLGQVSQARVLLADCPLGAGPGPLASWELPQGLGHGASGARGARVPNVPQSERRSKNARVTLLLQVEVFVARNRDGLVRRLVFLFRIPSTICFGQGASRGFKSSKKKKNQQ